MEKEFNFTGTCIPEQHYMIDTSHKIDQIIRLIEKGKYISINRPRQFGKTTTISLLAKKLRKQGSIVIKTSFEGLGRSTFSDEHNFVHSFVGLIKKQLAFYKIDKGMAFLDSFSPISNMEDLDRLITGLVNELENNLILFIDEVDRSSNNDLFIDFLGLLRNKYLARNDGEDFTFQSVILVGVHDIKSLKQKIAPGSKTKYNSPWNIAMDLPVDLSFLPEEIATMLTDYAEDKKIKIDIPAISERLYYYTSGYPFLVSKLCYIIDDKIIKEGRWLPAYVDEAVKYILKEDNTNFDSLIKNLENNPELYGLVEKILLYGARIDFVKDSPMINLGVTHGIFRDEGYVKIHNRIYEQRILNYMTVNLHINTLLNSRIESYNFRDNFINTDDSLDFEKVLLKFQAFMKEQYTPKDQKFIEENGRLIFLAFIKPIINGKGMDFKEVQISEEKRLDVVITYGSHKYIAELKIWRGESAHQKGIKQLTDYLDRQNCGAGYLLIFDFNRKKEWKQERITAGGKNIFAVWV